MKKRGLSVDNYARFGDFIFISFVETQFKILKFNKISQGYFVIRYTSSTIRYESELQVKSSIPLSLILLCKLPVLLCASKIIFSHVKSLIFEHKQY